MTKNKRISLLVVMILLIGLCLFFRGDFGNDKATPIAAPEINIPTRDKVPAANGEQKPASVTKSQPKIEKMELSPEKKIFAETAPVDINTYSYSIRNENKERKITPGVVVPSSKTVIMKIPGDDASVRVQRDTTYHPDSYNVLWDKKY